MALFDERSYSSKDGLTLYYRRYGSADFAGTPLVCLPGLTRTSRDFADIAAAVSTDRLVLCPDLRGRGQSAYDKDYNNYAVPVETDDVWRLLEHEGVDQVIVLGTSRGGIIAMVMAAMDASRLKAVILNDIGPQISPEGLARIGSYVGKAATPTSWEDAKRALREMNQAQYPSLSEEEWERFARRIFVERDGIPHYDYDPNISETLKQPSAGVDLWPQFRAMKSIPTLVLRGEHSDILSAETVQRMKVEKPDLETLEVKERGHVPFLDEPEVEDAVLNFLARVDAPRRTAATA